MKGFNKDFDDSVENKEYLNEDDLKRVLKQCGMILFKRTHE